MDEGREYHRRWRRLKVCAGLAGVAFAVTLAVVVGNRLSDEALAVLAGAVCGVGAAIPTSLLIVAVSHRRDEPRWRPTVPQGGYPPVVVVTPPGGQQRVDGWNALPSVAREPMERHFTVVGGSTTERVI